MDTDPDRDSIPQVLASGILAQFRSTMTKQLLLQRSEGQTSNVIPHWQVTAWVQIEPRFCCKLNPDSAAKLNPDSAPLALWLFAKFALDGLPHGQGPESVLR